MNDSYNLVSLVTKIKPDEIYNLDAQSHVAVSFEVPEYTAEATGVGTILLNSAFIPIRPLPYFRKVFINKEKFGIMHSVFVFSAIHLNTESEVLVNEV